MFNSHNTTMAYTSLRKLVPIDSPKISSDNLAKNTMTEVLQSEPVKRLLNQPNIVLKAISLTSSNNKSSMNSSIIENNNSGNIIKNRDKPDDNVTISNSHLDDEANFLPSKNDGKSEVALLPIKHVRKKCGHYESCENIICDVNFQQYVDYEGSSPILAFNIDESEIDAPVSKHCDNLDCDALSIDHNRCRRAIIRLCRYDIINRCDICDISLKTRKSRFNHKNCKRKDIYQHNNINSGQILRERMRIRELQMMAELKMKKNNYTDPSTADDKAMEILKNNTELIVIPKTRTKLTTVQSNSLSNVKPILNQNNQSINKLIGNISVFNSDISILSQSSSNKISLQNNHLQQQMNIEKYCQEQFDNNSSLKQMKIQSTSGGDVKSVDSQIILTSVPNATVSYPLSTNDWIMAHTSGTPILPAQKPYLMPVRVVPIANLKSEPSLLHQTQGIPRFCIIADNSASPQTFINLQAVSSAPIQNIQTSSTPLPQSPVTLPTSPTTTAQSLEITEIKTTQTPSSVQDEKKINESSLLNNLKTSNSRGLCADHDQKRVEKKLFICTYCSKRFLTEWYFKMHIARHIGEIKAKCEICDKTFTHHYDLKRHVNIEHKEKIKITMNNDSEIEMIDEEENEEEINSSVMCDTCENIFISNIELSKHKCKKIINCEANNGGIVIIDSMKNPCNEEIEKENGIVRGKNLDTLPTIKLREIAKRQKKIIKKRIRKRKNGNKKHFNHNSDSITSGGDGGGGTLKC